MVRIEKISLQNFKNIQDTEVHLNNFNVLVGPNNSGKSNFLKVIPFLNFLVNGSIDSIKFAFEHSLIGGEFGRIIPNKFEDSNQDTYILVGFVNTILNKYYEYSITISPTDPYAGANDTEYFISNEQFEYRSIGGRGPMKRIFTRRHNTVAFGDRLKRKNKVESVSDVSSVLTLLNIIIEIDSDEDSYWNAIQSFQSILETKIFYFSNTELNRFKLNKTKTYRGRTVALDLDQAIADLERTDNWELFQNVIRAILNIRRVEILRINANRPDSIGDVEVYALFEHLGTYKVFNDLSDGSVLILALVVNLLSAKQDVILIEEPENSTHPKFLIELIRFMRTFEDEKQFLITSHSIPLINELNPEDVLISRVDISGRTSIKRVDRQKDLLKELRKGYVSFSDQIFFNESIMDDFE